jgi:DsbC/DsbD-like thiol-disulfide interchange protein
MSKLARHTLTAMMILVVTQLDAARPSDWTNAVEVWHDENLCVSYRVKVDGPLLVVRVTLEPGWHTFAMDNKQRAAEKLAGKQSLGIDQPTEISLSGSLELVGPWYQSSPKDFSKPELRWFSWGFDQEALFVSRIRRSRGAPASIKLRGQACTETTCKNIAVVLPVPRINGQANVDAAPAEIDVKTLVPVR